ncbi:MAG: hypothetical protein J6D20_00580 [Clostridia bacterium]|nr:hypothetical protein [Clostridia bacterium]
MINDLNKHKKSDTIKWIIVFACIILLTAGLLATMTDGFTNFGFFGNVAADKSTTEDADKTSENNTETSAEDDVINTVQVVNSDLMKLSVASIPVTTDETGVVNSRATSGVGVIATVLPEGSNSALTWDIQFLDSTDPAVIGRIASDYVAITYNNDDCTNITVTAVQPFGSKIKIIATSVANPEVSAYLVVDYEKRLADNQTLSQSVGDFFINKPSTSANNLVNGIITDTAENMAAMYGEEIVFGQELGVGTVIPSAANYLIYVEASDEFIAAMQQFGIASKCADYVFLGDDTTGVTLSLVLNTLVGADIIPEADGSVNSAQITKFNQAAMALGSETIAFSIKVQALNDFGVHNYVYNFYFDADSVANLVVTGIQFNVGNIVL